jgi:hypothetical protein
MATVKTHKKQFCSKGHDTFIVGRNKYGQCKKCLKDKHPLPTGAPKKQFCPKGHDTFICGRIKSSGQCVECKKQIQKEQKWKEYNLEYKRLHADELKTKNLNYREEHKEEIKAWQAKYKEEHPELISANRLKHETNRNLRIVAWTDWDNILEFERCKPEGMTIDHIIPLQGDLVSGLNLIVVSKWYGKILEEAGLK